jgi:hypothetical protein
MTKEELANREMHPASLSIIMGVAAGRKIHLSPRQNQPTVLIKKIQNPRGKKYAQIHT